MTLDQDKIRDRIRDSVHADSSRYRILAGWEYPKVLVLLLLIISLFSTFSFYAPSASGRNLHADNPLVINLFQDIDVDASHDGAEPGVAGIKVDLYDATTAAACATLVTDSSGQLTFSPAETASCVGNQLRMQVDTSTYPANMLTGPINLLDDDGDSATPTYADAATDASADTQIVDLSSAVVLNIGVVDPTTFTCSAENAYAMTTCYVNGNAQPEDSPSHDMDALVGFPYTASGSAFPVAGTDHVEPDHLATMGDIGTAWGLAWSQQTEQVYVAAFLKRHVALGPSGLDGIYRVGFGNQTASVEPWLEVENDLGVDVGESLVPDEATRNLPTALGDPSYDSATYPLIASIGLGDIDLVADEALDPGALAGDGWIDREFLLAVDLQNKDVLVIDTTTQELVTTYDIPAPTPACTNGTHRPWAVDYRDGKMFVGIVCDGSTESATILDSFDPNSNLEAIVYEYDLTTDLGAPTIPATPSVSPQPIIRFSLDYMKGGVHENICLDSSNWHPWRSDVPPTVVDGRSAVCWPTPILADIDFSDDGNLLLAFMDRSTHQWGWVNYSPDPTDTTTYKNMSGGDILMACLENGTYVLEDDGSCGQLTSANPLTKNEGPGGREFFYGDSWPSESSTAHLETANNGIAVLPGSDEVISAGMDPYGNPYHGAGGINWFSTTDGTPRNPGYMLYASLTSNSPVELVGTFGKSGGLGDVDLICPQMPITIGDYVWLDSDGDGIQDPDELPLAGVTVYLQLANGTILSTVTDANGRYQFDASRNQSYSIAFDVTTTTTSLPSGASASTLVPTTADAAGSDDQNDSDLSTTLTISGAPLPALTLTTDKAGNSNHTGDAGFVLPRYDLALVKALGPTQATTVGTGEDVDYVITVKNQGDLNSGDFVVTDQIPVGMSYVSASGADWTCAAPAGQTVTCTFNGNLEPQEITELALTLTLDDPTQGPFRNWSEISVDSSDDYGLTDSDSTPNTNTGNDDGPGLGTPPDDDVVDTDDVDYRVDDPNSDDEDDNDFADVEPLSLVSIGDTVWHDANNDGLRDDGEMLIEGVLVELLDEDGNVLDSMTTDGSGNYLFQELEAGVYQIRIPEPPAAYPLSSTPTDTADNRENDDDNGIQDGGYGAPVVSPLIDLQPGQEPTDDGDDDDTSDLTIDFGFWLPEPAIEVQKTVYRGHDDGSSCPGVEQETGVDGDAVTYCFVVTNTGNVHLDEITLSDPDLGISRSDMTLLTGTEPLAPDASMTFFYETNLAGDLLNTVSTSGNPTDEEGNDIPNLPNPTDDDDAEVLVFVPGIQLEKTVYHGDEREIQCPGRELVSGVLNDPVTYCFVVTNTGDTYLDSIEIVDAVLGISRSDMTYLSGSEPLAPGEQLIYYYVSTLTTNLVNVANTSGNPTDESGNDIPNLPNPTDEDDAAVQIFGPGIQLQKSVYTGHDSGGGCPGIEQVSGVQSDPVTYCFVVTNTGDTYLNDITISDPDLDIDQTDMTLLSGSQPLAPGASMTFYAEELMAGGLVNTARTSGNPTDENGEDIPNLQNPTDDDDAEVLQFGPGIRLDKTVYAGHSSGAGCPGDELVFDVQNAPVTYCFVVTNVGNSFLSDITLDDPDLGVARSAMTLLSGAEPLAPGASMIFYIESTLTQDLVNEANSSGNPTDENGNDIPNLPIVRDDNDAQVELTAPGIALDKTVYAGHNNGANCPGSDLEIGVADAPVTYCFVVTNVGDTYLSDIVLTDPNLGIDRSAMVLIEGSEPLAPGDSLTFYYNATIVADLTNTASAAGNPTDENGVDIPNLPEVNDSDVAEVELMAPGIEIEKTVYFGHDGGASCAGGELATGASNDPVTYCFVVTNTGDTYLNEITLADPDLGIDRNSMTLLSGAEPLAPNAALIYFYETLLVQDLVNVAETSGNPTDENGNDIPNLPEPTAEDDAEVEILAAAMTLEKTVYPGHSGGAYCPGTDLVYGVDASSVTYCFVVTNTGSTYLSDIQINDSTLGIAHADLTWLRGEEPLAPGRNIVYFYEGTITQNLVNVASATGNPTDENGSDIPNLPDVSDENDAEVQLAAPSVDLQKTVYIGHDSGASCPGGELVSGSGLTEVTYCFVATNTGNTYLNDIDITDRDLNVKLGDLTLYSGAEPLAPGASIVYYYETVRTQELLNRATVIANPSDENGDDIPNLPYQFDQDTAMVEMAPGVAIGDTVWLDINADGIQDPDELGLPDVEVTLYNNVGVAIDTTTTGSNGNYLFADLEPGTYSVGFELPSQLHLFSPQNQGTSIGADSDANVETGRTTPTLLEDGETDLSWDAGIYAPPDLMVTKKPNLTVIQPDGVIVYAIDYANMGLGLATNVVIQETVPDYTEFVPELNLDGWVCENGATTPGTVCQFSVGTLAGLESGTLALSFAVQANNVLPDNVEQVINTISITDDGTHGELSFSGQSIDSQTVNVVRPTSLNLDDEPDLYEGVYDQYIDPDGNFYVGPRMQPGVYVPLIQ